MAKDDHICPVKSCRFHGNYNPGLSFSNSCDYFSHTGISKIAQIPPEERGIYPCRLYERGKHVKIVVRPMASATTKVIKKSGHPCKYDWLKAYRMWVAGKTDTQIAEELGCNRNVVQKHRIKWGYPNKEEITK